MRHTFPSRTFTSRRLGLVLAALALFAVAPAFAGDPPAAGRANAPLPVWEQLTQAQREQLIAPMRDRWNNSPDERQRMFEHARRWQQMTPEERKNARRGMKRWEHMSPEDRGQMRALYAKMRGLDDEGRRALMTKWRAMTPEQRRAWAQANPAPPKPDRPHPPRD